MRHEKSFGMFLIYRLQLSPIGNKNQEKGKVHHGVGEKIIDIAELIEISMV